MTFQYNESNQFIVSSHKATNARGWNKCRAYRSVFRDDIIKKISVQFLMRADININIVETNK